MSCNGCRILRKGCNENCILRQSLQSIESPQSQANATIFVAKFFGRAGLMSFLSSVPESQRPALFQSLLFEACGRTVNPVNGAVGLLWTGNWQVCQSAVETVLTGGILRPLPEFSQSPEFDEGSEANIMDLYRSQDLNLRVQGKSLGDVKNDMNLSLTVGFPVVKRKYRLSEERRPGSPSDESEMTTLDSYLLCNQELQQNRHGEEPKHLRLFF